MSCAFGPGATMADDMETLELIGAIIGLVVAVVVFAAMALSGALADGADLPTLRRHRHRTH